ncbi:GNAT family N-acetyltransferase [Lacticaseibacillus camelliae]|uniref:N-acetyltransferase domain-containing protein n=2 Tax=Lacticaseibacillus camelliae TaxID=381742 RepID=A0A0R2FAU5_9LACO|nr:GNAT family N-acetyltransferase [Lacticaseibacillus camelliae]KRN25475.1 hypothetical protein FC75_GL000389 [Lacticaseibacillus camelliae DSM 22697 = JCM 13995]
MAQYSRLETVRLTLRPFLLSDAEALLENGRDPRANQWSLRFADLSAAEANIRRYWLGQPAGKWVIEQDGVFLGAVECHLHQDIEAVEIGYLLLPKYWGQGVATEAARAVMQLAFGPLEAQSVLIGCDESNQQSASVARRLGLHLAWLVFSAHQDAETWWVRYR